MEVAAARSQLPLNAAGQVDYSTDFFGEKVFLTVSGQLNGEQHKSWLCGHLAMLHVTMCVCWHVIAPYAFGGQGLGRGATSTSIQ